MTNPFEDQEAQYLVLKNAAGQHSLWPVFSDVPAGWSVAHGPQLKTDCMSYIEENWTDMRPLSA
jgi:MbtH protein